jgi:predicted transcriptional regulator
MKISSKTKARLGKLRNYPKEPLEDVVERMVTDYSNYNVLTEQEAKDVEEGLADIKAGRIYTTKQLNEKLGL